MSKIQDELEKLANGRKFEKFGENYDDIDLKYLKKMLPS